VQAPKARGEELCDACTKTHINDDPAQYYDYALASLIKFQLHDHICTKILKQDVRACDYSGNQDVGKFLQKILAKGATRDWREVMREATGEDIGPRAMLAYFQPAGRGSGKAQPGPRLFALMTEQQGWPGPPQAAQTPAPPPPVQIVLGAVQARLAQQASPAAPQATVDVLVDVTVSVAVTTPVFVPVALCVRVAVLV
jgi:hypothetical protein